MNTTMGSLSIQNLVAETYRTLREYGLHDWRVEITSAKRQAGACHYTSKTIRLSAVILDGASYAEQRETVLHEAAHALTPGHSHDSVWRAQLVNMGGTGARTHKMETPEGRYRIVCPKCGDITTRHSLNKSMKHMLNPNSYIVHEHRKCGSRMYAVDTQAKWTMPPVVTPKPGDLFLVPVAASEPTPPAGPLCSCSCGDRTKGGQYLPGHDARHVSAVFAGWLASEYDTPAAVLMLGHAPKLAAKLEARIAKWAEAHYGDNK